MQVQVSGEKGKHFNIIASFSQFYLLLDRRKSRSTSHRHLKAIVEWVGRIRVRVHNPVEHKDGPAAMVLPIRSHTIISSRLVSFQCYKINVCKQNKERRWRVSMYMVIRTQDKSTVVLYTGSSPAALLDASSTFGHATHTTRNTARINNVPVILVSNGSIFDYPRSADHGMLSSVP